MFRFYYSNLFTYIKLFFFLIFSFTVWSCQNVSDGSTVILSYTHPRGNPLVYQFTVNWSSINNGYGVWLKVMPGPLNSDHQDWSLGLTSGASSGTLTGTYTFPQNNPSPSSYGVQAEIRASNNIDVLSHSPQSSIQITYKKFNIIQLAMSNDGLFPNDLNNNYWGGNKLAMAFGDANTVINVNSNVTNLSNQVDFSAAQNLLIWSITNAGGDWRDGSHAYGLGTDVAILCGVENIPNSISGLLNPIGQTTDGFTFNRSDQAPPIAFVRYDIIRANFSDTYSQVRAMTGVAIHELGHARGIDGDDPNITHSGNNSLNCLMHSPFNIDWYTNPTFCDYHINLLNLVTW